MDDDNGDRPWKRPIDPRFAPRFNKPCYQIFVGGLRYSTREEPVRELFERFGTVVSVIIPIKKSGHTSGTAFVTYVREGDAKRAIAELDHTEFQGRTIFVEEKKHGTRDRAPGEEPSRGDDRRSHRHDDRGDGSGRDDRGGRFWNDPRRRDDRPMRDDGFAPPGGPPDGRRREGRA
jgi:THO complex subunit 4